MKQLAIISSLILFLGGTSAAQPDWREVKNTVRATLNPRVEIRGLDLRLGDIAEIEGVDPTAVARARLLRLGGAPVPGRTRLLGRASITKLIERRAKDGLTVRLAGASSVQITPATITLSANEVGTLARRWIFGALGWRGDGARIAVSSQLTALDVPAGRWSTRFEVVPEQRSPRLVGLIKLRVRAIVDGHPSVSIPVNLVIRRHQDVLIVTRRVGRDRPVTQAQVRVERRLADGTSSDALHAIGELRGLRARRMLAPGTVLTMRDLRAPPVVVKGDPVTVRIVSGGLAVTGQGFALENGAPGEVIPVRTGKRRRIARARVIDSETVEVVLQGGKKQ
ncbi:MAG: flagella basal body P-ring formation protein FlgA [Planctomycetes bacterium]|nr:flagella basal body P-ring formation protein FlgA [Planctomycetota bacterium]